MSFDTIVKDIKSLKIQGAANVAKEATKSLKFIVQKSKAHTSKQLLSELDIAVGMLINTRPTEPAMRNSLHYVMNGLDSHDNVIYLAEAVIKRIDAALNHFKESRKLIVEYGKNKIKNGYIVFTHCHSSTVVDILIAAKKQGIDFEVHNTETRPRFQGRKTSQELAKAGIPVKHYTDSAAKIAMKKADICLFGTDAIQSDGKIINKIGTGLFCDIARKYDIPVFCCMNSWKFDPETIYGHDEEIEMRDTKEIWSKRQKNLTIMNYAFEGVSPMNVTGVISEFGIYRPTSFIQVTRKEYPWLIK